MFRRIFVAALAAGAAIGLVLATLQQLTLAPLILKAENYEHAAPAPKTAARTASFDGLWSQPTATFVSLPLKGGGSGWGSPGETSSRRFAPTPPFQGEVMNDLGRPDAVRGQPALALSEVLPALIAPSAHAHEAHPKDADAAAGSASRTALTFLATTLVSIGFAFMLVGAFAVSGRAVDAREGLLWGIAGFAVFALAPAFGLAPMLPGSAEADLVARQIWWIGTAAATAGGIALAVFGRWSWAIPAGLALIVLPHVIGAPHAEGAGTVPPELAASFAARSLVIAAVFWTLLGWAAGALYARLGRTETA